MRNAIPRNHLKCTRALILNSALATLLIIKITISSLVIGLKMSYFPLIRLPSCYQTVCYWIVCYWTVCYRGLGRLWRSEDVFSPAPLRLNVEIYSVSVSFISWLSCPANLNEKPEIAVARKLCLLTAREFAR